MRRLIAEVLADGRARDAFGDAMFALETPLPIGTIVEVDESGRPIEGGLFAAPGTALSMIVRIAISHGASPIFSPEIEREVEALLALPDDPSLADRTDVPFVTIDTPGSKDLDQALHLERIENGHRVRYALADAAYYVRPGTALFDEALARGASFYFPGFKVPMLPTALSEGLVSLLPNVPRRALVFDMRIDDRGVTTTVERARIVSRAQLTYEGVQAFFDRPDDHPLAREPFASSLLEMKAFGELRIADAAARDVVQHRRENVEVGVNELSSFVLYTALRHDVDRYNEQISILCNAEGAALLAKSASPSMQAIYRVHPPPEEDGVRALAATIDRLVDAHSLDDRWRWRREHGQSLARYLSELPAEPSRVARAIERQAIMMNVRSEFSTEEGQHHGVGARLYARFSAPMREIVGVFVHKELIEHLEGRGTDDAELCARVIESANRAKDIQRGIDSKVQLLALDAAFERDAKLPKDERPIRRGTILGLTLAKVYVVLDDPPLEVKLWVGDLERTFGPLALDGITLQKPDGTVVLRTGDAIDMRVDRRDRRGRWVLAPV
jgi:ribonuclease R